jgi:hypothetical protein
LQASSGKITPKNQEKLFKLHSKPSPLTQNMLQTTGRVIGRSFRFIGKLKPETGPAAEQMHTLRQLLERAQATSFGKRYHFGRLLSQQELISHFMREVPIHTYASMREKWWQRCLNGEKDVTWPGTVKYFALSSGTSDASSKHIPVTRDMIRSVRKVGLQQMYSLANFPIPPITFGKGVLMLGSTTSLNEGNGYYEGDMSGISTIHLPSWISRFYFKPGQDIARQKGWQERIARMVNDAGKWDIGMICGLPSWVQILLEEIIRHYRIKNIHELWPNLNVYIHGGVSFEHYRESFDKLMGKPVTYIETYMASEGSFGFKAMPGNHGIRLVLNAGVFFEFVPFTSENFDKEGEIKSGARSCTISDVKEGVNYALLLSTCAGAWRYLIGDVIRFTNATACEIAIVGRTRQFLNLCGEHVSIDNINQAVKMTAEKLGVRIGEFAVTGIKHESLFAYRWYIGCDDAGINAGQICNTLDVSLCAVNDDYHVERQAAIRNVSVKVYRNEVFHKYLQSVNQGSAMSKFPRVLKNGALPAWEDYLNERNILPVSEFTSCG